LRITLKNPIAKKTALFYKVTFMCPDRFVPS